jgi:hypothetical protein
MRREGEREREERQKGRREGRGKRGGLLLLLHVAFPQKNIKTHPDDRREARGRKQ